MKNESNKIAGFLKTTLAGKEVFVEQYTPLGTGEMEYYVFLEKELYDKWQADKEGYLPDFSVCQLTKPIEPKFKDHWVISRRDDDPGVYMRKDGSGEPPSSEMIEYKTNSKLGECLIDLGAFIAQSYLQEAITDLVFLESAEEMKFLTEHVNPLEGVFYQAKGENNCFRLKPDHKHDNEEINSIYQVYSGRVSAKYDKLIKWSDLQPETLAYLKELIESGQGEWLEVDTQYLFS